MLPSHVASTKDAGRFCVANTKYLCLYTFYPVDGECSFGVAKLSLMLLLLVESNLNIVRNPVIR